MSENQSPKFESYCYAEKYTTFQWIFAVLWPSSVQTETSVISEKKNVLDVFPNLSLQAVYIAQSMFNCYSGNEASHYYNCVVNDVIFTHIQLSWNNLFLTANTFCQLFNC